LPHRRRSYGSESCLPGAGSRTSTSVRTDLMDLAQVLLWLHNREFYVLISS
jgi:hypothetical protein